MEVSNNPDPWNVASGERKEVSTLFNQLRQGHSAAAIVMEDADTYASSWKFDDEVRAEVIVRPRDDPSDAPGEAINLRLADLGPSFLHEELTILQVRATDPLPFYFCAFSIVVEGGIPYLIGVRDFRSVGFGANSTFFNAHAFGRGQYEGIPGGDVLIAHSERSGIPAVNNRRKQAAHELVKGMGKRDATGYLRASKVLAIQNYFVEKAPGDDGFPVLEWIVARKISGALDVLASSPIERGPKSRPGGLADHVAASLCVQAFGVTRPPDQANEPVPYGLDPSEHPGGFVAGTGTSEWQDHVGDLASAFADGLASPEAWRVLGMSDQEIEKRYGESRISELMKHVALTRQQARIYLLASDYELPQREVARRLKLDASLVSRQFAKAKRKVAEHG